MSPLRDVVDEIAYRWEEGALKRAVAALALAAAAAVAAYFLLPHYFAAQRPPRVALLVEVEGRGSVSPSGLLVREEPFDVVLEAVPEEGWRLARWLVNGTERPPSGSLELYVAGNTTVVAVFEEVPYYSLTIILHGRGTCSVGNSTWPEGSRVVLEFRPAEQWRLANVTVDGRPASAPLELVVDRDVVVEAWFERGTPLYSLTVIIHGGGSCSVGNSTWPAGSTVCLEFYPEEGWELYRVVLDGREVRGSRLELVMDRDLVVEAWFWRPTYGRYSLLIVSNALNAYAYVNGERVELPHCISAEEPFSALVEAPRELSINETYSWWLGWWNLSGRCAPYFVEQAKLVEVSGNLTLEIHYVLGLRELPYAREAYLYWPPMWYGAPNPECPECPPMDICDMEIEDGYVRFYNFSIGGPGLSILLGFDEGVEGVWIEIWTNVEEFEWCLPEDVKEYDSSIELYRLVGQHWRAPPGMQAPIECERLPRIWFRPCPSERYLVFLHLNGTFYGLPEPVKISCAYPNEYIRLPDADGRLGVHIDYGFIANTCGMPYDEYLEFLEDLEVYLRVVGVCP